LFLDVGTTSAWDLALDVEPGRQPRLSPRQLEAALRAMADFVDLKSTSTLGHSTGVARLAETAGRRLQLSGAEITAIRHAALVHDLGRTGVSSSVWEKSGTLDYSQWERVRLHPYYTERVLARSPRLAAVGRLGALHHERLDGSGYHRAAT